MHRKQFLRQTALTLPAAFLAPNLLFGKSKSPSNTETVSEKLIVIQGAEETKKCEALEKTAGSRLRLSQLRQITYQQSKFIIETKEGQRFSTPKLALQGVTARLEHEPKQHFVIEGDAPVKLRFGQKKQAAAVLFTKEHQLPQVWLHCAGKLDKHVLSLYLQKDRAGILQVS
jgi:hypothetical protein